MRLSAVEFDIQNNDRFVNLTNWAVQKNCAAKSDECMLDYEEFRRFISNTFDDSKFERMLVDI